MKPNSRNRIVCPDCGKSKLLFETESKAKNFIKFNGIDLLKTENQTIEDLRVYYCPSCCGYHITSKPYKVSYDFNTRNLINAYKKNITTNKTLLGRLKSSNEEIISEIIKLAQNANISTKKDLKQLMLQYFAQHSEITKQKEDNIRCKINRIFHK